MQILDTEIPDIALYGVLAYFGYVLIKPLIKTSDSVSAIAGLPAQLIGDVQSGNFATEIQSTVQNFWNTMNLGIPKKLGLF